MIGTLDCPTHPKHSHRYTTFRWWWAVPTLRDRVTTSIVPPAASCTMTDIRAYGISAVLSRDGDGVLVCMPESVEASPRRSRFRSALVGRPFAPRCRGWLFVGTRGKGRDFLLLVIALYIVLGTFLTPSEIILVTVPVLLPVAGDLDHVGAL
jgi:hypothetical protein